MPKNCRDQPKPDAVIVFHVFLHITNAGFPGADQFIFMPQPPYFSSSLPDADEIGANVGLTTPIRPTPTARNHHVNNINKFLVLGGGLSILAALLHIGVIIGGPEWYRFFGAGEELASMAEQGSWYPAVLTFGIAVVLFIWGLYAFAGAGLLRRRPPFLKASLVIISAIYLLRGLALAPAYLVKPELVDAFLIWSSLICLGYGVAYAIGTTQVWTRLSK